MAKIVNSSTILYALKNICQVNCTYFVRIKKGALQIEKRKQISWILIKKPPPQKGGG